MVHFRRKKQPRLNSGNVYIIRQIVFGLLITALVGLCITGIWYGSRLESLTISSVEVVGGITIDHDLLRERAETELTGEYYRLVPKRFAWTYPKQSIISSLESIERVKEVRLERDETTLIIAFDEYIPKALWCNSVEGTDCLFIDQTGYAFGNAPQLTGGSFVRYINLTTPPTIGQMVLSRQSLEHTNEFIEILEDQLDFYVTTVEVDAVGDVFYTLAGGGELKATFSDNPTAVLENLVAILESDAFSHLRPGEFQYIDLRFGNKVYVNEEAAPTDEEGTATSSIEL